VKAKLTILGSRAGEPGNWGATAGYLVSDQENNILLDCGFGVPMLLTKTGCFTPLDTIVISHLHADHVAGLLTLAYMYQLQRSAITPPLVLLPPGGAEFIKQWQWLFSMESYLPLRTPFEDAFRLQEYERGSFILQNVSINLQPLRHASPNYGVRLCGANWSLTYTGDTAWCKELIDLAGQSDTLLSEATYQQEKEEILIGHGHLTGTEAGMIARESDVKRLILTHFSQESAGWLASLKADAARGFGGKVDLAWPAAEFDLGD
jgi:ribonuclease BN (tRNA processing enzyme)